jgi:hypothetical protein
MKYSFFCFCLILCCCGESTQSRSKDSIAKETTADGDTVLIRYPDDEENEWYVAGYYANGNKYREVRIRVVDSTELSDAIWYYPSGKIWKYKLYSYNFLRYYRDYDESGAVTGAKGQPFADVDTINHIIVQQTGALERIVRTGTIPNCKISLLVSDFDLRKDTSQFARDRSFLLDLIPPRAAYPIDFDEKVERTQYVFWLVEDTITGESENGCFIDYFKFQE